MKKISLALIGLYVGFLNSFAQTTNKDTSPYKSRELKVDEVNILFDYYHQEGNSSPVTGGIGSQKLTDFENTIELKLSVRDKKNRQHNFLMETDANYYTSASTDKIDSGADSIFIDTFSIASSNASTSERRVSYSTSYTVNNENKGIALGANASCSKEYDYLSFGYGVHFTKTSQDKNRELAIKLNAFSDVYTIIPPIEFRDSSTIKSLSAPGASGASVYSRRAFYQYSKKPRNSYNASFVFSQVINMRLQIALLCDIAYQKGFLSTPFHRVYFNNGSAGLEVLPNSRFKIPLGIRANYFLDDRIIIRTFYRYYQDDWGLKSNTINIETPIKLTPFISLSPFYRFYVQNAVNHYGAYGQNDVSSLYHTSDNDLSKFNSIFWGLGFRLSPPKGVLGIKRNLNTLELRYGFYKRSNHLISYVVSLNLRFK